MSDHLIARFRAAGGDMTNHRPAPLPVRLWLRMTGFSGITLPWGVAYYRSWPPPDWLQRHEQVHLDQIQKYGSWGFLFRYAIGFLRHGYWNHPMEIEARRAE